MTKHNGGRFNTVTHTKIKTDRGTILKVTHYIDSDVYTTYKIKPTCCICKNKCDCFCFNDDNADNPEQQAYDALLKVWICNNSKCIIKYLKDNDPNTFTNYLKKNEGNEEEALLDYQDNCGELEDGEGDFC